MKYILMFNAAKYYLPNGIVIFLRVRAITYFCTLQSTFQSEDVFEDVVCSDSNDCHLVFNHITVIIITHITPYHRCN